MQNSQPESRPKVSVAMITYNHEQFIEQAVRSVMMQETDFEYELIIGEDCSTDNTRGIVLRLKEEFPDKIRLILHEQNIGMAKNFIAVYEACAGEYIALLEGDDYWTHPRKLDIQVEYMHTYTDCGICAHSANVIDEKGNLIKIQGWDVPPIAIEGFLQLLLSRSDHIITGSVMIRSEEKKLPEWISQLQVSVDWALYIWLLTQGGMLHHLQSEPMSVYRLHTGGITHVLRLSKNDNDRTIKILAHQLKAANDAEIVFQHVPLDLQIYMRKRIINIYLSSARLAYRVDSALFQTVYDTLCQLSPNGRYIPDSPRHLAILAKWIGYPQTEWLSGIYRTILPIQIRKLINKS